MSLSFPTKVWFSAATAEADASSSSFSSFPTLGVEGAADSRTFSCMALYLTKISFIFSTNLTFSARNCCSTSPPPPPPAPRATSSSKAASRRAFSSSCVLSSPAAFCRPRYRPSRSFSFSISFSFSPWAWARLTRRAASPPPPPPPASDDDDESTTSLNRVSKALYFFCSTAYCSAKDEDGRPAARVKLLEPSNSPSAAFPPPSPSTSPRSNATSSCNTWSCVACFWHKARRSSPVHSSREKARAASASAWLVACSEAWRRSRSKALLPAFLSFSAASLALDRKSILWRALWVWVWWRGGGRGVDEEVGGT